MAESTDKTDIWVYAHWKGMSNPRCIGILSAHRAKGRKAFSFEYDKEWRRIVFNIMVSNTDDHLRNHGFILTEKGWILSPAFDINPSIEKSGLSLCIDTEDNSLDLELARSVGSYFQLTVLEMEETIKEVRSAVKTWNMVADEIGIPPSQQELMRPAFQF